MWCSFVLDDHIGTTWIFQFILYAFFCVNKIWMIVCEWVFEILFELKDNRIVYRESLFLTKNERHFLNWYILLDNLLSRMNQYLNCCLQVPKLMQKNDKLITTKFLFIPTTHTHSLHLPFLLYELISCCTWSVNVWFGMSVLPLL